MVYKKNPPHNWVVNFIPNMIKNQLYTLNGGDIPYTPYILQLYIIPYFMVYLYNPIYFNHQGCPVLFIAQIEFWDSKKGWIFQSYLFFPKVPQSSQTESSGFPSPLGYPYNTSFPYIKPLFCEGTHRRQSGRRLTIVFARPALCHYQR